MLLLAGGLVNRVYGQESEGNWADPINLSRSGSAAVPQLVIDGRGVSHVFWQDQAVDSYIYTQGTPEAWTAPAQIELPFGTRSTFPDLEPDNPTPLFIPYLYTDPRGFIHAFWIDDEDSLFYSRAPLDQITDFAAWNQPEQLAGAVTDLSAAVDNRGNLHLSYINKQGIENNPAGVYHRRLDPETFAWTNPSLLYRSAYLQDLPIEQANIQLAIGSQGESSTIFIGWDNRAEEKVFIARSPDGGISWSEPAIVDQRQSEDGLSGVGPSNILIASRDGGVLLIWVAGHGFDICSQYYQWSTNDGLSWTEPRVMLEEFTSCPQGNEYLGPANDLMLFSTSLQDQSYLLAWDGGRWSDPQPRELNRFIHPDTFRSVEFGCHQMGVQDESRLQMVGCGLGSEGQSADIWATSRFIGEIPDWFPPKAAWTEPLQIAESELTLSYPQVVADTQGRFHAFWTQENTDLAARRAIFYSRQQGDLWTPPVPIIVSEEGEIHQSRVVIGFEDRLLLAWVEDSAVAYFSQSSSDQATLPADWSTPTLLPTPDFSISDLDIALNQSGYIYISYTIPFNENRGVYLTWSEDNGGTWNDPIKVFDGVKAGWKMVGPSRLSVSENGSVYILWTELDFDASEGNIISKALHYSQSTDAVDTGGSPRFQEAALVDESPVIWHDLIYFNGTIHRLWQEGLDTGSALFHDYSSDNGQNWSSRLLVSSSVDPVAATVDTGGQLHVIEAGDGTVNYYVWNGRIWMPGEGVKFPPAIVEELASNEVAVAFDPAQMLGSIFSGQTTGPDEEQPSPSLFFTRRNIDIQDEPVIIATLPPDLEPTDPSTAEAEGATPQVTVVPSPSSPGPTQTPEASNGLNNQPGRISGLLNISNPIFKWALVVIPVLFLLLAVSLLVVWSYRSSRR